MYRIVKVSDGKELGMVETVTYVKIGSGGILPLLKKRMQLVLCLMVQPMV